MEEKKCGLIDGEHLTPAAPEREVKAMGEYAKRKSDGIKVKIGTCESMYYLRYEDRNKVEKIPHSLDASREKNLFWRIPFPDEDNIGIGEYNDHSRGLRLYKPGEYGADDFTDKETIKDPGTMQISHASGLLVNVKCYHGEKLPEGSDDVKAFWNGRSWFYELAHLKNMENGEVLPVVRCRHCGHMWRYGWADILPYIADEELKARLEIYDTKKTDEKAA